MGCWSVFVACIHIMDVNGLLVRLADHKESKKRNGSIPLLSMTFIFERNVIDIWTRHFQMDKLFEVLGFQRELYQCMPLPPDPPFPHFLICIFLLPTWFCRKCAPFHSLLPSLPNLVGTFRFSSRAVKLTYTIATGLSWHVCAFSNFAINGCPPSKLEFHPSVPTRSLCIPSWPWGHFSWEISDCPHLPGCSMSSCGTDAWEGGGGGQ